MNWFRRKKKPETPARDRLSMTQYWQALMLKYIADNPSVPAGEVLAKCYREAYNDIRAIFDDMIDKGLIGKTESAEEE